MSDETWNYFAKDQHYSDVLKDRLAKGVAMDSATALAGYMNRHFTGDLRVVDYGSGPGHYYPVLTEGYRQGHLDYLGVDIDASNVAYGNRHFAADPRFRLVQGSVLAPAEHLPVETNCIISANTLPHVPTIRPLLEHLAGAPGIRYFLFRLLIGDECVQIKKHLLADEFDGIYDRDFQFNNIYSPAYLKKYLGEKWTVSIQPDVFDQTRLAQHALPAQATNAFYSNRVSRAVGSFVFKGDIYMPWKFAIGTRKD